MSCCVDEVECSSAETNPAHDSLKFSVLINNAKNKNKK